MELVEEYITNYDLKDGSNVVQGRIIEIDETILKKMLFLSIGEITVGVDESSDFSPGRFFKGGMSSFEKNQGWQTVEALSLELAKWFCFMVRQLGLYRHFTYMSKRLLYVAIGALKGMVFNWAAYVATRIFCGDRS